MWAFLARFFFRRSQPFLFCRISCASFSSGSLVLVLGGFLTTQLHTIRVCISPGSLAVVYFSIGFLHVKISVSYLVIHQMVTLFKALCAGGGNVTFGVCMYSMAGLLIVVLLWVCLQVSVL